MKHGWFVILVSLLFLNSCCSLDYEITRCGQKCRPNVCCAPLCYGSSCKLREYVPQDELCNNGSASYDAYYVVKPTYQRYK